MVTLDQPLEIVLRHCIEPLSSVHPEPQISHEGRLVAPAHELGPRCMFCNFEKDSCRDDSVGQRTMRHQDRAVDAKRIDQTEVVPQRLVAVRREVRSKPECAFVGTDPDSIAKVAFQKRSLKIAVVGNVGVGASEHFDDLIDLRRSRKVPVN